MNEFPFAHWVVVQLRNGNMELGACGHCCLYTYRLGDYRKTIPYSEVEAVLWVSKKPMNPHCLRHKMLAQVPPMLRPYLSWKPASSF